MYEHSLIQMCLVLTSKNNAATKKTNGLVSEKGRRNAGNDKKSGGKNLPDYGEASFVLGDGSRLMIT